MVSIIIPNYNKGPFLSRSLDSVLNQTSAEWEAIVVDDSSTDDSWNMIQEYVRRDQRITSFRNETNRGGCYSRNFGAKQAKGEYLIFLDSDDWLATDCVEQRIREISEQQNNSVDLLVFPMVSVSGERWVSPWQYTGGDALASFLRHIIVWQTMMPLWRREAFERIGGFDESFPRLQDVELHTRALLEGLHVASSKRSDPDCFYFIEEGRMTTNHLRAAEIFVRAVSMYVAKMRTLISEKGGSKIKQYLAALRETVFQAYRNLGDLRQAGKLSREDEKRLRKTLLPLDRSRWSDVYRMAYDLNLNRLKGFNYLFRKCYRLLVR